MLIEALGTLGDALFTLDLQDQALDCTLSVVAMCRRLNDDKSLADNLYLLGAVQTNRDEFAPARTAFEESIAVARELGDKETLQRALLNFAVLEVAEGDFARALALDMEALAIAQDRGDTALEVEQEHSVANDLRLLGSVDSALSRMRRVVARARNLLVA